MFTETREALKVNNTIPEPQYTSATKKIEMIKKDEEAKREGLRSQSKRKHPEKSEESDEYKEEDHEYESEKKKGKIAKSSVTEEKSGLKLLIEGSDKRIKLRMLKRIQRGTNVSCP